MNVKYSPVICKWKFHWGKIIHHIFRRNNSRKKQLQFKKIKIKGIKEGQNNGCCEQVILNNAKYKLQVITHLMSTSINGKDAT